MFAGHPVVVRMRTGDDVVCVAIRSIKGDGLIYLNQPLLARLVPVEMATKKTSRMFIELRYAKWMPLTSAYLIPIYADSIMAIAPLAMNQVDGYLSRVEKEYPNVDLADEPEDTKDNATKAMHDFILDAYEPTGEPN